jgi:two-component system CheB/CheR fusion protein
LTGKQKVSRWFLAKSTSIRDDKGEIVLWIVACTDIHDQKLFTDALKNKVALRTNELVQANAELKQSNADLQQYASIASHDLQEPLRKIITFASLLKRKYGDVIPGEALEYLTKIGHSSDRMSQLIHELLE